MSRLFAVIDASVRGQLGLLTIHRMPGAMPVVGKYRLIDFALSNMKHSGIKNVAIFPYGNYRSLQDHIGSGKRWDLDRRADGLFVLPPKNIAAPTEDMLTFQRMYEHNEYFQRSSQEYVLITQANILWNIDFNDVLDHHIRKNADITEVVHEKARLKTFLLSKKRLLEYILNYDAIPYKTLNDVVEQAPSLNVSTYLHRAYVRYVRDVFHYMKANLDMLRFDRGRDIFLPNRPIMSKEKTAPPVRYGHYADVTNSLLASGAIVDGTVRHSVIGRDVTIKRGAIIEHSVVLNNAVVEQGAVLQQVVLDKGSVVKQGTVLEGTIRDPYITQKNQVVTNQTGMRVLKVAAEMVPFIKTGGLGDVLGDLSVHLAKTGLDVSVALPFYPAIKARFEEACTPIGELILQDGLEKRKVKVLETTYKGVDVYFFDNFYYFERDEIYGHDDDVMRYAFFCRSVVEAMPLIGPFDLVHAHDWHAALLPALLEANGEAPKTLLTVHNIDYQGTGPYDILARVGLKNIGKNHDGKMNALEIGIEHADKLSTVSETYRDELRYDYYGKNLTPAILKRERDFYGILNGISGKHSPESDPIIAARYGQRTLEKKALNKHHLQKIMNLDDDPDAYLIGSVGRLSEQKGFAIMIPALWRLLERHNDVQFVLLGTGDETIKNSLRELRQAFPRRVAVNLEFDATEPNYIYAGADAFLMPSRVEPCGLSQMIAMHYGTVPIVRETGGLADTVSAYDSYTGRGTGFTFFDFDVDALVQTLETSYNVYKERPDAFRKIRLRGMRQDFSLARQASKTVELYRLVLETRSKENEHEQSLPKP